MEISVSWDGSPVRQQFGACNIVADGVATLSDGRTFRINASATRGARKPEVMLRYQTEAKRGAIVPESMLADVRAAALASFAELLAPIRAEIVAAANREESEIMAARNDEFAAEIEPATVAEPEAPAAPRAELVANTTRACYWRTAGGSFIATKADAPAPLATANGYARLDSLMTLKGETAETIRRVAALNVAAPARLARVASRTIDGTEWLGACGWCGDIRAAYVMTLADAEAVARLETDKERSRAPREGEEPGEGRYSICARPYDAPALYSLADYNEEQAEAARLDSLYGEGAE